MPAMEHFGLGGFHRLAAHEIAQVVRDCSAAASRMARSSGLTRTLKIEVVVMGSSCV